ncbi:putative bifunctional inhibitor/plant lipid transfer protein/seed storage helical [Helianthus annuus]|uniref:2S seed storage protein-like n=1 Tax=Helianthus annuus TaxID=4232 RepID=UPI001652EFD7|nr:2S seed storage protein-like [Helianthus annuus]KAJ0470134.1 putative bifunctional inhibitor/plant lipid transfer protein/seed storage helical [Helianthus annuus]
MAKLEVVAVLAMVVMVAFVEVASYRTIITTVTEKVNDGCYTYDDHTTCCVFGDFSYCFPTLKKLSHCQMHLLDNKPMVEQQRLNLCCNQLKEVEEDSQCEAIKQVVKQVPKQQHGGQLLQVLKKAQMLPNQCNIKCSVGTEQVNDGCYAYDDHTTCCVFGDFSYCFPTLKKLSHCQMHLLDNKPMVEQQSLNLCCNQLKEVEEDSQCEAIKQVVKQVPKQQHGGKLLQVLKKAQMLPNQCNIKCSVGTEQVNDGCYAYDDHTTCCAFGDFSYCFPTLKKLSHCQMHLLDNKPMVEQQRLNLCCNQLKEVEEDSQCEAIKQVVKQVPKQQHGGQLLQVLKKAQMLPNQCKIKCSVGTEQVNDGCYAYDDHTTCCVFGDFSYCFPTLKKLSHCQMCNTPCFPKVKVKVKC